MKKSMMALALGSAALMLASCGSSKNTVKGNGMEGMVVSRDDQPIDEGYLILSDAQRGIVNNNNVFALNLFRQMNGVDSKVVSPMSVAFLMGMLANGADGQTRQEIMNAIGCKGIDLKELNEFYKMMITRAGKFDKAITINIANCIVLNDHYQLKDAYVKTMKDDYQAGVESLDFSSSSSLNHINKWCSKHTDGMIPEMIKDIDVSAVSYIMNAIYFNGTWQEKFDKLQTKLENFRGYTRDIKKAQMMHRNGKYMFVDNDMFSAVSVPYGNGAYEMTVMLPNESKSIDEIVKSMDAKSLCELPYKMNECVVDLKLPRFSTSLELPLNDIISKLGAPTMFTSSANFSNFANGDLYISKMLQKAKIEVSEEGTKAAAVTMAMVAMTSLNPAEPRHVQFHANRPFVYMITEASTGAILFMGQYTGSDI